MFQLALHDALSSMMGSSMLGVCGWYYRKIFSNRSRDVSARIVILLGRGFEHEAAARAAAEYLLKELHDVIEIVSIVVTSCGRAFRRIVHACRQDL
jgi:hypothetical protein